MFYLIITINTNLYPNKFKIIIYYYIIIYYIYYLYLFFVYKIFRMRTSHNRNKNSNYIFYKSMNQRKTLNF